MIDQAGDDTVPGFEMPVDGDIIAVSVMLEGGFTADGSNYMTITIQDGGADGSGTDSIASRGGASVAWAADTVYDFTMTTDPYPIDEGDWITIKYDETSTCAYNGQFSVKYTVGQQGTA
jgi:hypothetical protein|tara:strand:+ start:5122 stop:5478 length:357 start_codon:yes stop_codon:yes gene_type:complete